MRAIRCVLALLLLAMLPLVLLAEGNSMRLADGANEVLVIVNGKPVTYQQIVGDRDMQSEINAVRQTRGISDSVPDSFIEKQIVFAALENYVVNLLLEGEADKLQININNSTMRAVLAGERKRAGVAVDDDNGWAKYVKARYGLTVSDYRERRRTDIRRKEALYYLAGARGALPAEVPVTTYFSLSVTPKDLRREFEATRPKWRIARDIDFRQFKLYYPQDTSIETRNKLLAALTGEGTGVYPRVEKGESLEAATDSLKTLIDTQKYPGVRFEISARKKVKDDSELDATTYGMVLSVPATGGLSKLGALTEEDEEGVQLEVVSFVQVFSRRDGDARNFENPKVQESLRNEIFQRRFQENEAKVTAELLKRAAIVPEKQLSR